MANSASLSIPKQTTSFVGRERQIQELRARLQNPECRLLTLTGPGGIGKTRLAIAVAQACEVPVVYTPLQAVASADMIPSAVADAAGITLSGEQPLSKQLLAYLCDERMLLVLDNFEHLLDGTEFLLDILQAAPGVKLVLTSREALNVREEWLYAVPGLDCPPVDAAGSLTSDEIASYDAVQLFVDRAQQVRQDFRLQDDGECVIAICHAVDGMPLAIELAASWLRALDRVSIARQLRQNLDLLATQLRNVPERHRSIRAVFDGSWHMLSEEDREVFAKLSVFHGGFTYEAAAHVAGASVPVLGRLVSKSLVYREHGGRYHLHELLRQYAAEKLAESADGVQDANRAHSAYYMQFLAGREEYVSDAHQLQTTQEIANELENVRKAWHWAVDHVESQSILKAARALHNTVQFQSRYIEGANLFQGAAHRLEAEQLTPERGAALNLVLLYYGWMCIRLGQLDEAERAVARATELHADSDISALTNLQGHPGIICTFLALLRGEYQQAILLGAEALSAVAESEWSAAATLPHAAMASAYLSLNDYASAKMHAERALALAAGNRRQETFARDILGQVACAEDDLGTARRHFEAAYQICEDYAEHGCMALHLANLADVDRRQGHWTEARQFFLRSLALYRKIGDRGGMAHALLGLGLIAHNMHEPDTARRHFHEALTLAVEAKLVPVTLSIAEAIGEFLLHSDDTQKLGGCALSLVIAHPSSTERVRRQAADVLAKDGLETLAFSCPADSLPAVIAALLEELADPGRASMSAQPLAEPLTEREQEVLHLLADGRTNPEIAERLVVTVGTVKTHASHIYGKLGVENRTQAVARARELGLLA
jgi:predicted ATPase/DNA-binding CsgD family transcriptional regulator